MDNKRESAAWLGIAFESLSHPLCHPAPLGGSWWLAPPFRHFWWRIPFPDRGIVNPPWPTRFKIRLWPQKLLRGWLSFALSAPLLRNMPSTGFLSKVSWGFLNRVRIGCYSRVFGEETLAKIMRIWTKCSFVDRTQAPQITHGSVSWRDLVDVLRDKRLP